MKFITRKLNTEIILLFVLLVISAVAHGYNMFAFPYYENDEAIYLGRAWSLVTQGEIAPYTYWYDHAPIGWIMIALWYLLTSDVLLFGFSINSGRVFILLVHLFSSVLVYFCMKKLSGSRLASALAVLIFSLSPLAIYFQRRVLLDNLMVFWLLLSLYFLLYYEQKLRNIFLSALSFALAFLTKETAIFVLPAFLFIVWTVVHTHHKIFGVVKWVSFMGLVVSIYFLYALLKGELFPAGMFDSGEHVSLLGTLLFQAGREGGSLLDFEGGHFWYNMRIWFREDPWIMGTGISATIINLFLGLKDRSALIISLISLFFLGYLMRGGIVIEFYILPLFPFFAMNIAYLGMKLGRFLHRFFPARRGVALVPNLILLVVLPILFFAFSFHMRKGYSLYTSDQTLPQKQAIDRILSRKFPDAFYVMDNYGFIDLNERNNGSFSEAHHYWKVEYDPEIKEDLLFSDPTQIDYFLVSPQLQNDVGSGSFPFVGEALGHSRPIEQFWNDGWGVELWATNYPKRILHATWDSYKVTFIKDGQVLDPQTETTTSEGQAYALLRAVYMDDRETFDDVYHWTKQNLQRDDGLFIWRYGGESLDTGTASDADTDIATALLFASKRWSMPEYSAEALEVLGGLWEESVVVTENDVYVTAGNWAQHGSYVTMNPSYLSPAQYRIFADADPRHDWDAAVETSYQVLNDCTFDLSGGNDLLPPEWCAYDLLSQQAFESSSPQPLGTEYGYNAIRVPMRVSWDVLWYDAEEGREYLENLTFIQEEWDRNDKLVMVYTHDGDEQETYESVQAYAGNLGLFLVTEPEEAKNMYDQKIYSKLYEKGKTSYWEDADNYYSQNLAWFATAMYGGLFENLWE